jgi:outer membrane immunogenic protein
MVFGIEGNLALSTARGSATATNEGLECGGTGSCLASISSEINSLLTVVGRAGISSGSILYYLLGGLAVLGEEHTAQNRFDRQTVKQTRSGFVLGFGAEFAVWQNWTAKIEYNYMDFGKKWIAFSDSIEEEPLRLDQNTHVVKLGLSYLFH